MQSLTAGQHYRNSFHCGYRIFTEEGFLRFWTGTTPRLVRLMVSRPAVLNIVSHSSSFDYSSAAVSSSPCTRTSSVSLEVGTSSCNRFRVLRLSVVHTVLSEHFISHYDTGLILHATEIDSLFVELIDCYFPLRPSSPSNSFRTSVVQLLRESCGVNCRQGSCHGAAKAQSLVNDGNTMICLPLMHNVPQLQTNSLEIHRPAQLFVCTNTKFNIRPSVYQVQQPSLTSLRFLHRSPRRTLTMPKQYWCYCGIVCKERRPVPQSRYYRHNRREGAPRLPSYVPATDAVRGYATGSRRRRRRMRSERAKSSDVFPVRVQELNTLAVLRSGRCWRRDNWYVHSRVRIDMYRRRVVHLTQYGG